MTPLQYIRRVTAREHRALCEWLAEDLNRPSRADHYQIETQRAIYTILAGFAKGFRTPRHDDLVLTFERRQDVAEPEISEEEAMNRSMAAWKAAGFRMVKPPDPQPEE